MIDKFQKSETSHSSEGDPLDTSYTNWRISMRSPHWKPPTDIYETETNFTVRVEIAGMQDQDFFIELNGRELTIRGNRQETAEKRAFHQMEIPFGEFAMSLEILEHISQLKKLKQFIKMVFLSFSCQRKNLARYQLAPITQRTKYACIALELKLPGYVELVV